MRRERGVTQENCIITIILSGQETEDTGQVSADNDTVLNEYFFLSKLGTLL